MNEIDKAQELFTSMYCLQPSLASIATKGEIAKKCAIVCVKQILKCDPINPWNGKDGNIYWNGVLKILYKM